jgi:heme/copper-type cytochrome/quinol oxidase subunit 3
MTGGRILKNPVIPNGVLGMLIIITTEIMFFGGLISGYIVNRAENPSWQTLLQPSLPLAETALNSLFLIISAVTYVLTIREAGKGQKNRALLWLTATAVLGEVFVLLQGREWVALITNGMTASSSLYGAFFYTIIGTHAFHVIVGILMLIFLMFKIDRAKNLARLETPVTIAFYWMFVVWVWPILYYLVYMF